MFLYSQRLSRRKTLEPWLFHANGVLANGKIIDANDSLLRRAGPSLAVHEHTDVVFARFYDETANVTICGHEDRKRRHIAGGNYIIETLAAGLQSHRVSTGPEIPNTSNRTLRQFSCGSAIQCHAAGTRRNEPRLLSEI